MGAPGDVLAAGRTGKAGANSVACSRELSVSRRLQSLLAHERLPEVSLDGKGGQSAGSRIRLIEG
jgi:hypothetical protein